MKKHNMDNNGFTLLEMVICFALLGILLIVAAQVISSTTQVYYYSKSVTYGIQASQVVATEIRGDMENAIPLLLQNDSDATKINPSGDFTNSSGNSYSVYIKEDGTGIAIINNNGKEILYYLENDETSSKDKENSLILVKKSNVIDASLSNETVGSIEKKFFTSQYIGMDYEVKDIHFSLMKRTIPNNSEKLPENSKETNYPVIVLDITVNNSKYGDYAYTEYIPLYNFYGLDETRLNNLIHDSIS